MPKRLTLVALILSLTTTNLAQGRLADGPFVSGSVVDADSGVPVVGAEVRVVRTSTRYNGHKNYFRLADGRTDSVGQFSLGFISRQSTQLTFPFEGSVSIDFTVGKGSQTLHVRRVEAAPEFSRVTREQPGQLVAVTVKLFVSTTATAQGQSRDNPVRVGGDVAAPKKLEHVIPSYPADAPHGNVLLELTVSPTGAVEDVRVIRGVAGLTEAAITATQKWVYEPLVWKGEPVWCVLSVLVANPFKEVE